LVAVVVVAVGVVVAVVAVVKFVLVVVGAAIGGGATTELGAEFAAAEPFLFVTITVTTIVDPTSSWVSVYPVPLAEAMRTHAAPPIPQRFH
jgi:hypothetical protein